MSTNNKDLLKTSAEQLADSLDNIPKLLVKGTTTKSCNIITDSKLLDKDAADYIGILMQTALAQDGNNVNTDKNMLLQAQGDTLEMLQKEYKYLTSRADRIQRLTEGFSKKRFTSSEKGAIINRVGNAGAF